MFSGRVVTGSGEAAGFTRIAWVRDRFLDALGIDPFPGTLNLIVDDAADREAWTTLRARPGMRVDPAASGSCGARCYGVRLNGAAAGIVVPEVPGYPPFQVEAIAALNLRDALTLADGDRVGVEVSEPLAARAVIFDVDGTLVDSLPAFRIVAERAAAPYGVTITDAIVREALNTTRPFWDLALPADCADRDAMMRTLTREAATLWPGVLREHGRVFPEVARVLRTLRDRGAQLGIVTGSRRGSLDPLRDAGLIELFEAIVTGDDVQRRKPDPEGLLACAAALQVEPGCAVYVGDTPIDMRAGRAAGMRVVGLLTGAGDGAALTAAGADALVATHARLLDAIGES